MIEKHPFKIQELKRKERKAIISNLLEMLFKANYEITVLCKKSNGFMKTKNYIAKNKVYYMYLIEKSVQIDDIATLLKGCSNWHYNIFVIIVGQKGLNESL